MKKVGIVIFDDFTDLDLFLPWDLLNRVRVLFNEKDWSVEILGTNLSHMSKSGLTIQTTGSISKCSEMDAVIIASGPGIRLLLADSGYLASLKLNPKSQMIAGLCSGALLLGALGYLRNQQATTYPTSVEKLREYGAIVVKKRFVQNGNVATSASCLAAQDVVHWMVKNLKSKDLADKVLASVQPLMEELQ